MAKRRKKVSVDCIEESRDKASEALPEEIHSKRDYETSDIRNHYMELDSLRGIAILGVFTLHATDQWTSTLDKPLNVPILNFDLLAIGKLGGLGVMLFFLLSGYLLTWTEERRALSGNYSLRSYALRRAFRLLPAYYLALLVSFLLWPAGKSFVDVVSHLTLMQGFVPHLPRTVFDPAFWSLTPEVAFYILLPLLILKVQRFYLRLALMVMLLAAAVTNEIFINLYTSKGDWLYWYLRTLPTAYLWIFITGVLLRMLARRTQEEDRTFSFRYQPHLASLLGIVSVGLLLTISYTGFPDPQNAFSNIILPFLPAIFFTAVLLGSPWLLTILRLKTLAFVGMISYSLFLLHNSVLYSVRVYAMPEIERPLKSWIAHHGDPGVWAIFAAYFGGTFLLSIAISYVSYRYIESPFLRRKPK